MKALLLILIGGLGLGAVYWKTQHPEGTVDDLKTHASATATRLKSGFEAIKDGGPTGVERDVALTNRLDDLEQRLASNQNTTPSGDVPASAGLQSRLDNAERRLDETDTRLSEALARVTAADTKLTETLGLLSESEANIAETQSLLTASEARLKQSQTNDSNLQATVDARIRENAAKIADVADLKPELTRMAKENDDINAKLDAQDNRVNLIVRRLDEQTLDQSITDLSTRLDQVDNSLANLTEANEKLTNKLDTDIASVAETADNLNSRINTLSSTSAGGADAVDADALSTVTANIDQRFQSMETKLATVNTDSRRIANLSSELNDTREKLKALEADKAATETELATLKQSLQELRTKGESLSIDTVQSEIRQQLSTLQSQVDSDASSENVEVLTSLLDATTDRIQVLEQRVQDLPASSSAADTALQTQSALEAQIAGLKRRIESIPQGTSTELVTSINSTISEVREEVDELKAQSFVTQADLRAQQQGSSVEYKIYFNRNSTQITEDAATVLNSFITQEKNRTIGVSIYGFTDRRGAASYNQQLALRRATNVRSYLIQNGFDYTKINTLSGLGEDAAAAELEDEVEDANQRVVVLFAAQP